MVALQLNHTAQFELLVVDNGSTDDTSRVMHEFADKAPFSVVCLCEPRAGLSFARNRGLAAATGELIMFTDDDCLVAPNWVQAALEIFGDNPLRVVGGRVELFDQRQPSPVVRLGSECETLKSLGSLFGFMHGANMSLGRAVVDGVGIFDVRLGAGTPLRSAEDAEFVYRAFIHSIPVTYEPTSLVHHDHGRTEVRDAYRQQRGYSIGMGAMTMKHLLKGRTDLVKPIYWVFRSAFHAWAVDRTAWRRPLATMALLTGAIQYIVQASWRKTA